MGRSDGAIEIDGLDGVTPVGRGAFSVVYKAYQPQFDRHVAVKVVDVDLRDERARRRFENECRRLGQLADHPNIVSVFDSGVLATRQPYLVMEFFDGGSLEDRVADGLTLSVRDALRVGVKLSGALATAHEADILHRDVKPANVLLSRFGEPALADFGIAAVSDELVRASLQHYHTPAHAAPEVLDGEDSGVAADIYSLVSTIYELLDGDYPFAPDTEGDTLHTLRRRKRERSVPDIRRDDVPPSLMDLLRRGLAVDHDARPRSAVELGHELQALERSLGEDETPLVVPTDLGRVLEDDGPTTIQLPSTAQRRRQSATPSLDRDAGSDSASPPREKRRTRNERAPAKAAIPSDLDISEPESADADGEIGIAWIPRPKPRAVASSRDSGRPSASRSARKRGRTATAYASRPSRSGQSRTLRMAAIALAVVVVAGGAVAALSGGGGSKDSRLRSNSALADRKVAIQNGFGSTAVTWVRRAPSSAERFVAIYATPHPRRGIDCRPGGDAFVLQTVGDFGAVACRPVDAKDQALVPDEELAALAASADNAVVCIGIVVYDQKTNSFGERLSKSGIRFDDATHPVITSCDRPQ